MAKVTKLYRINAQAAHLYCKGANKQTKALIDFWSKKPSFSNKEFREITALVIAANPGYGRFGGGNYADLEAGKKFSTWKNKAYIIEEVCNQTKMVEIPVFINITIGK